MFTSFDKMQQNEIIITVDILHWRMKQLLYCQKNKLKIPNKIKKNMQFVANKLKQHKLRLKKFISINIVQLLT